MADVTTVKQYLGIDPDNTKHDLFVAECVATALTLVDVHVGDVSVPADVLELAYTIVAADLFNRKNAPNGVINTQFVGPDGVTQTGMRIARDPLAGVYRLLGKWVLTW